MELKRADTPIFKPTRGSGGRANTWEFSSDFISGISQCLGQKCAFDECYAQKEIVTEDGNEWTLTDAPEYENGTEVRVLFDSNETQNVTDDIIIDVTERK